MPYRILHISELDIKGIKKKYDKVIIALASGDFASADVRKMGATAFYRARLDIRDRLLFRFVRYGEIMHILLLEHIVNHNYSTSRFLRGALLPPEDKWVLLSKEAEIPMDTVEPLRYLHPKVSSLNLLNKFISFDELQHSVYQLQPPLVIIGSAGSGKTALLLEKIKMLTGSVAYFSLSPYLVESAEQLYYANHFLNENQEVEFLSLTDYIASLEVPKGREIHFRAFEVFFAKHSQVLKIKEPYRVYEEFKGVITGTPVHTAYLSLEEYLGLGIKQSIFPQEDRPKIYSLFLKYREWMEQENWYDSNMLCFEYLSKVKPRFDYVVIDEVQDITGIQLRCMLQSLIHSQNFILTGDSNQIVHPNFFSWSKVKTYFHHTQKERNTISILQTNYRNSKQVVHLSNLLLKIKNQRFGSIDKESNYLVDTISEIAGDILLYSDDEKKKNELNKRTQNSTKYAVIVTDAIHKEAARKYFKTPLVFSVQEAKGLEYDNVILLNFVSNHEQEFREIVSGVTIEDLQQEELAYSRSANKNDKDAEIYKFYINAFYVAITRSIQNIYLFEKNLQHPAISLLQMQENKKDIQVAEAKSTKEEWLKEAQQLELQGKYEQAEQIRAKWLGYEYISTERLEQIVLLALDPAKKEAEVKKERKQLYEYAIHHKRYDWIEQLAKLQLQRAMLFMRDFKQASKEMEKGIRLNKIGEAKNIVLKYGAGITNEQRANPLMLALNYGQHDLITFFKNLPCPLDSLDENGWFPIDYLLSGFYKTIVDKQQHFARLDTVRQFGDQVLPRAMVYNYMNHRIRINNRHMGLLLLCIMRIRQKSMQNKITVVFKLETGKPDLITGVFNMDDIEELVALLPNELVPEYRKKRGYLNSILAANEISRIGDQNCKMMFNRVKRGWYIVNPTLDWKV